MAEIAIRITGKDDTGGAFRSAEDKARALNTATNRLAAAQFEASEAARKLMNAQAALARASDPTEQRKLTGEILKLRVAADTAGGTVDKLQREINEMGAAANAADDHVNSAAGATSKFAQAGNLLGQLGLGVSLAGIAAGAVSVGKEMIRLGMAAEQTEIAFTTLIGSTVGAQKHLEDLRDFAASTPFEFNDLTEASRKLQAFGFSAENVIPMMTDIGDAVAAMGGNAAMIDRVTLALGQMSAKGKIQAGEMLQLTEAGIPAWRYLADAMGLSTAEVMKLSEKGLIPADKAIQDILAGMRQDFGGMMAEQANTAAGAMSNLSDAIDRTLTLWGKKLNPILKDFAVITSQGINVQTALTEALDAGTITQAEYAEMRFKLERGAVSLAEAEEFLSGRLEEVNRSFNFANAATEKYNETTAEATRENNRFATAAQAAAAEEARLAEALTAAQPSKEEAKETMRRLKDEAQALEDRNRGIIKATEDLAKAQQTWAQGTAGEVARALSEAGIKGEEYEAALIAIDAQFQTSMTQDAEKAKRLKAITDEYKKTGDIEAYRAALNLLYSKDMPALNTELDTAKARAGELDDKLTRMDNKRVRMFVETVYSQVGTAPVMDSEGTTPLGNGRASGGPVSANTPYIVGERGPELFVPNASGRIVPNDETAKLGGMTVNMIINAAPGQSETAIAQEVRRQLDEYARRGDTRARL